MSGYIELLGAAAVLGALMDMLVPDGSFKKYCRLASGFMIVAVMLSPLTEAFPSIDMSTAGLSTQEAEAEARARILIEHKQNLERIIGAEFPGSEVYVEVDGEGNVFRVTMNGEADEAAVREYLRESMGVEGSAVKINEDKGAS